MSSSSSTVLTTATNPPSVLNINVGILGHVDSGKTSLVRALSTELSTAALDKNPQSQERGITLDLGFSAFTVDEIPEQLQKSGANKLQFTLVDCPGHASLIKTIIGGAQIIDMMILVIDIVKGIQTQTAECLVIGEITTENMIIVLNKVDLLPEEGRDKLIEKIIAKIKKVLASTKFANAPFVVLSASPGGSGKLGAAAPLTANELSITSSVSSGSATNNVTGSVVTGSTKTQSETVKDLVTLMKKAVKLPQRNSGGPFLFLIDHCFPIKGQGTVMTGTVLAGSIRINDTVELPSLHVEKKIKSMQMFKKPIQYIQQGDRAGICVTNLDATTIERGLAATVGSVISIPAAIALVKRIRFYKGLAESESKFHVTVGHTTVMANVIFFGAKELSSMQLNSNTGNNNNRTSKEELLAAADADAIAVATVDSFDGNGNIGETTEGETVIVTANTGTGKKSTGNSNQSNDAITAAATAAAIQRSSNRGIPTIKYDFNASFEWQSEILAGRSKTATTVDSAPSTGTTTTVTPSPPSKASAPTTTPSSSVSSSASSSNTSNDTVYEWQWAALMFDNPILAPVGSMIIGSKLDTDIHTAACRIAFYGRLADTLPSTDIHVLRKLNIYKQKEKIGTVDRIDSKSEPNPTTNTTNSSSSTTNNMMITGPFSIIGKNLFRKETDMNQFIGLTVHTKCGQVGIIDSAFGKSGKFRATFHHPEQVDPYAAALGNGKSPAEARLIVQNLGLKPKDTVPIGMGINGNIRPGDSIYLRFKKYMYEQRDEEGHKNKFLEQ